MTASAEFRSGKGHRDENFPVASWIIRRRHRPVILAFYEFVRVADDIADHPTLYPREKLVRLDRLEASLTGRSNRERQGVVLREILRSRGLSPRHAQDLLHAFRQDVTKQRYADWDELIDYCSFSAMPVGRFVLDVHGESHATWPASDALCAALQIINHLQDCGEDYRQLGRVYIPLDLLSANALIVDALGVNRASPVLKTCLHELATRTGALLERSRTLPALVNDVRLGMEISAMQALAGRLVTLLQSRDPLSETVRLTKREMLATGGRGAALELLRRLFRPMPPFDRPQARET